MFCVAGFCCDSVLICSQDLGRRYLKLGMNKTAEGVAEILQDQRPIGNYPHKQIFFVEFDGGKCGENKVLLNSMKPGEECKNFKTESRGFSTYIINGPTLQRLTPRCAACYVMICVGGRDVPPACQLSVWRCSSKKSETCWNTGRSAMRKQKALRHYIRIYR